MDLSWLQSILYGLLSGLMDILPVSAQAHQALLLKFFGISSDMAMMNFMIRLGIFAALYISCRSQLVRMSRARAMSKIPKRRRKRPLDTRSLMDLSMLKTMLIPAILGLFLYRYTADWASNLLLTAVFLTLNGLVLYVPQFLPTGNRDSRTLSRVEGLLMGLGGTAAVLPGVSAIGVSTSIGSVCGVERSYSLNMALLMDMALTLGFLIYGLLELFSGGVGVLTFAIFLRYLLTALTAFGSAMLAIRLLRHMAANQGFSLFGLYCFGLALFTFILYLLA